MVKPKAKKWLIGAGLLFAVGMVAAFLTASYLSRKFEPYLRDQAIAYLQKRFNSDVQLAWLKVRLPKASPLRLLLTKGRGAIARVEGSGIVLRRRESSNYPPLLTIRHFTFDADLGTLWGPRRTVPRVALEGVEIQVPPRGDRPRFGGGSKEPPAPPSDQSEQTGVVIEKVQIQDLTLRLLPKDPAKVPLKFGIHHLNLQSAGTGVPMKYDADFTNPKPPGHIHSVGSFGPWSADEPGDTPMSGDYTFENADLGVFNGIAGILQSKGSFQGTLDTVNAHGEASVPDFRLKSAGNPVPLSTKFEVQVDGTNGNTILKPVQATLGSTRFITSGGVIKHDEDARRRIDLTVSMPDGKLDDLLRLAMKGAPFMVGRIHLDTKISIPPLSSKVREKLLLDGRFEVTGGKFLQSKIQDQIDGLSRRGQGQPDNQQIDEVVSSMSGNFRLENERLTFRSLTFGVTGAWVNLAGSYLLDGDVLDMHGSLRLKAKVSQTQSGWKRWALKPVDPFFSKNGAGTFLKIQVVGTSRAPKFGLDKGPKDDKEAAERASARK